MSGLKKWTREEYHNWIQESIDKLTERVKEENQANVKIIQEQQGPEASPVPNESPEQTEEEQVDLSESTSSWTPSNDEPSDESDMEEEIEIMKRDHARLEKANKGGKSTGQTNFKHENSTLNKSTTNNNNNSINLKSQLFQAMSMFNTSYNNMAKVIADLKIGCDPNSTYRQSVTDDYNHDCHKNDNEIRDNDNIITNKKNFDVAKGDNFAIQPNTSDEEWVAIGSGQTLVHRDKYTKINWDSYSKATRQLLLATFPKRVLATHSLTGKPSPAFVDKPAKMCLDPKKISDIIIEIAGKFVVKKNLIRCVITTKCADESKMFKARMKKLNGKKLEKENIFPGKSGNKTLSLEI